MVFRDFINKSDNAGEHYYELKEFGKCHRYHLPLGRNRLFKTVALNYRFSTVPTGHYIIFVFCCQTILPVMSVYAQIQIIICFLLTIVK